MSLFKKKKNLNFRLRKIDDEDDDENNSDIQTTKNAVFSATAMQATGKPIVNPVKPQIKGPNKILFGNKNEKSKPKKEKKTVLSFEDELEADDGIAFQEKKSSLSYKLRREMKKEKREKKRELKESKEKNKGNHLTVNELDELGIRIVNGREAEAIAMQPGDSDDEDEPEVETGPVFNRKRENESKSSMTSLRSEPWKEALESGKIPDANLIHKIRKERQKAREMGHMIPLEDTIKVEKHQNRLVREDENDVSEDDEKIQFSINQYEIDKKERKEAFEAATRNGSDIETDWELQQLKKAGACTTKLVLKNKSDRTNGASYQSEFTPGVLMPQGEASVIPSTGSVFDTYSSDLSSAIDVKVTDFSDKGIIKHLKESFESLKEVHSRHQVEADKIIDDLVTSKATVVSCGSSKEPFKDSFQFFQNLRGYVTDLRDCLNEKVGEIKKLEDKVMIIYRQEAQNINQRRRQDIKDQNNEYSPFAGKAAKADEYRIRRAAEREGRRTRRRRERERRGDVQHHDGTSTDDELVTSFKQTMQAELATIGVESQRIFEDVESDFASLENVMKPFEEWRTKDRSSYLDAYVSYNLSKIFSPFIRLELLLWNPLSGDDCLEIEKMKWFQILLLFGAKDGQMTLSEFEDDPDRRLISSIVEKVVLVKIKDLVKIFWDPLSHSQCVRLVNLVKQMVTFPNLLPSSKPLKELMQAVIAKIKDSIENDVFIPIFPKSVFESKTSGVTLFFQRQFWSAWKLLAAVLMWHRILSDKVIHELAIRSILNLYLLPALNLASEINVADCLDKTKHVINILPREWMKGSKKGETHDFIDRLENFLVTLASKLDLAVNGKELKEICDLVKSIGARTKAEIMMAKYL